MNTKQAITTLKQTIETLGPDQLTEVVTILELGAGNIFMTDRTLEDKRSSVTMELVDAIVYSTCDDQDEYQPEAEFTPCYAGQWELVLASLILKDDWVTICDTARELRIEHEQVRRR